MVSAGSQKRVHLRHPYDTVTMNEEDLYIDRPDLMTAEELEDYEHDPSDDVIPTYTRNLRKWLMKDRANPDALDKEEFLLRSPALGATQALLDECRRHIEVITPVQQRELYNSLKFRMLRVLISCSGAKTINDLLDILELELRSGTPAPIPDWYEFSTVKWGPRKMGYDKCSNRDCFNTEKHDTPSFARCARCKLAHYCCKECQVKDWKDRHKQVCKEGADFRNQVKETSKFLEMFASTHST